MRRIRRIALVAGMVALTAACPRVLPRWVAHAQAADSGTVTGRVYCADTQKPARFAVIQLLPVTGPGGRGGAGHATTGADGSFRMTGVAAGDYFADVNLPGYVQPLRGRFGDWQQMSAADRDRLTATLTKVSVAANQSVSVMVTIYRGATVSGTVTFDDGSPAPGLQVQAMTAPPDAGTSSQSGASGTQQTRRWGGSAQTDDRGQFRLTGISDGLYTVQATPRAIFPVYYGNTVDPKAAKKLELHAGDDVSGVDIQVPAAGMHRVTGVVTAQPGGRAIPHALVQLQLATSSASTISTVTGDDGSFTFAAVPDGRFTAQVASAYDSASRTNYSGTGQPVEVNGSDVTDVVLSVSARN